VTLVVDASATLSWFFRDEFDGNSQRIISRVESYGATVPVIWRLEVTNGLRSAVRRRRLTLQERDAALGKLDALAIGDDTETNARAWTSIVALSDRHDLTPYDAAYWELAIRLGAEVATRDMALASAAKSAGVTTVPC
jgi:predicted nucleic acid-binding protein